jgi:hypothetical protein
MTPAEDGAEKSSIPLGTRALLEKLAEGDPGGSMSLADLLDRFNERAYGLFLLLVLLPCFIPVPAGQGTVCGSFIILIGIQFLMRMQHPWLPGPLARHQVKRRTLIHFRKRMDPWLERMERVTRPRNLAVLDHPVAHFFTGLLLIVLGVLLALPLPLTNVPFGFLLLAYSLALIERDGRLMLVAWFLGLAEIAVVAGFSGELVAWASSWFG